MADDVAKALAESGTQGATQFGPFGRLALDPRKLSDVAAALWGVAKAPLDAAENIKQNYRPGAENEIVNQDIGRQALDAASVAMAGAPFAEVGAVGTMGGKPPRLDWDTPLPKQLAQDLRAEGFNTDRPFYHGTVSPTPFERYDLAKAGSANDGGMMGEGVYMHPNFDVAKGHTTNMPLWRRNTNYKTDRPPSPEEIGHITENYIRGKVFDIDPNNVAGTISRIREIYPDYHQNFLGTYAEQSKPFSEAMQRAGYSHVNDPDHALITLNPNDVRIVRRMSREGAPLDWDTPLPTPREK